MALLMGDLVQEKKGPLFKIYFQNKVKTSFLLHFFWALFSFECGGAVK